jgi:hypothetical protein
MTPPPREDPLMCLSCDPYRPGAEDVTSTTVEDAARFERERAEALHGDDDRPDPADLV